MTNNEKEFENFVRGIEFDDAPDPNHRDRLEQDLLRALTEQAPRQIGIWRAIMKTRMSKIAAAAVIAIIVLGGVTFWPGGGAQNDKWWLGPSTVWGQEIMASLEKVKTLVYSQRGVSVSDYGLSEVDVEWERRFCSENAYRSDRYDHHTGTTVVNTQWILREPNGPTKYEVAFEYQCYFQEKGGDWPFYSKQMDSFRYYVDLLKWADRILDTKIFEGRECVGFEIDLSKWGKQPKGRIVRVWFDVETKLPARIEKHGFRWGFDAAESYTIIHDQFEYCTEVPADIFTPQIPEGFVNARPDDIRTARKGEMTFADVPAGLKDEIVAALKNAQTVVYQQASRTVYLSPNAWRYDYYSDDRLRRTEWYVFKEVDTQKTGFEIEDKDLRLVRTTVDFESRTYQVSEYPKSRHPMHKMVFLAGLVDRADRMLEKQIIDGIECIGFEISAKKYGDNPDSMIHRLWFNADTKLLVRMEFEWDTDNNKSKQELKRQFEREQFQWNPELPADTFTPKIKIPDGFELISSDGR
ncbi:MAG: hypothetical protein ACYS83_04790 [Planctomycetota bacterium]|jgi:outer membrane lipoprotein-sorting protein